MKSLKITFWISTILLAILVVGVPIALSSEHYAQETIVDLGYPDYFGPMIAVFNVVGSIVLLVPFFKSGVKEWAYAGFAFSMIAALVSEIVVKTFTVETLAPVLGMALLLTSWISYDKMQRRMQQP